MPGAEFWIVAGPNGAGKTTLVQAHPIQLLLPGVRFLNPDDIALGLLIKRGHRSFMGASKPALREAFFDAANQVEEELRAALGCGEAVGVETVLSSEKYQPLVSAVREQGGFIGLIYVALATPELACRRVARRAHAGGHDVPVEKIRSRWARSLANLAWFAERASAFWVFDNSDEHPEIPPLLLASGRNGRLEFIEPATSEAVRNALSAVPRSQSA